MSCARLANLLIALLIVASLCSLGCGAKDRASAGGGFGTPAPAAPARPAPASAQQPAPAEPVPEAAAPAPAPPRAARTEQISVDDYVAMAQQYETQEAERRQREIESMPPSTVWVPLPEAPPEETAEPESEGGEAAPGTTPAPGSAQISQCPFDLHVGSLIALRQSPGAARESGFSVRYDPGISPGSQGEVTCAWIKSLRGMSSDHKPIYGDWTLAGIAGQLLRLDVRSEGDRVRSYWVDQPFEIRYKNSPLRTFSNTAAYRAAIGG